MEEMRLLFEELDAQPVIAAAHGRACIARDSSGPSDARRSLAELMRYIGQLSQAALRTRGAPRSCVPFSPLRACAARSAKSSQRRDQLRRFGGCVVNGAVLRLLRLPAAQDALGSAGTRIDPRCEAQRHVTPLLRRAGLSDLRHSPHQRAGRLESPHHAQNPLPHPLRRRLLDAGRVRAACRHVDALARAAGQLAQARRAGAADVRGSGARHCPLRAA